MNYFYTDPLAAAWMAKHHGMKFQTFDYGENKLVDQIDQVAWGEEIYHHKAAGGLSKYFIHPDSVKLLEPQEGDLINFAEDECGECGSHIFQHFGIKLGNNEKIIQRNGIAFMWPEQEKQVK